jgi:Fe-S-cluster containining protein/uncharacterized membrane protein
MLQSGVPTLIFGNLLILLAGLFCAIDISLCRFVTNNVDPRRITQIVSFVGAGLMLLVMVISHTPFQVDLLQLPAIALLGIGGIGISTLLFLKALKLIGTIRTTLIYSSSFVFGVIFAATFLHEKITILQIISVIMTVVGFYLLRSRLGKTRGAASISSENQGEKEGSYGSLCSTCKKSCCTSFVSPFLVKSDIERLKEIGLRYKTHLNDMVIDGKKVKTIKRKEGTTNCIFWDKNSGCTIYEQRPFDCRIFPFDIFKIDGKYYWIVYSCNPNSDWKWTEVSIKTFEENPQFNEILESIDLYSNLDEINKVKYLDKTEYTIIREVKIDALIQNSNQIQ